MDGDNWYIWAFVSPEDGAIRYEIADTRGGGIAKKQPLAHKRIGSSSVMATLSTTVCLASTNNAGYMCCE